MSIGDNIRHLRESHGMTQLEFAQIAGVSDKAVSTWENGLKIPRMGPIQKISDHFGVSLSELLSDDEKPLNVPQFSPDEEQLLSLYRNLNREGQEKLLGYATDLAATGNYKKNNQLSLSNRKTV